MEQIAIPNNGCEVVVVNGIPQNNRFKVNRQALEQLNGKLPQKDRLIKIIMGNGSLYYGMIYHKNVQYIYIRTN